MLNPSAERELTENYRLSTEKARQWWNNQAFESRKNIVIESDAVINDDQEVEDQIVADVADSDYDELPDETKQEIDVQIDEEEDIEEIFEVQGEEYLQCSKCDDLFTSNEDYDVHKSVDHGEEPEDFEESDETYKLTMNPDLTREALREANSLLTETEEKELYGGYDKNGDIQSSVMPYNVPAKATGKYNDNPNEFFYSNKIFRAGNSSLRTASLGESKATEIDGWNMQLTDEFEMNPILKDWIRKTGLDWDNSLPENVKIDAVKQYQNGVNAEDYKPYSYESKSNETNYFHSLDASAEDILNRWLENQNESVTGEELPDYLWDEIEKTDGGSRLDSDDIQNYIDDYFNTDYEGESKASEDDYEERAEWNWLTNKDPAPEVDYGQVDYEDDGVSDISVPNAEPKGEDKNEFLDDVDIKLDEVNFVYPTKSNESTKSYIKESEPFDEEYEEFEDSDDEIIEETITVRKLTGYSDNSIAQELHINYGVSHEEALEKVYSVEVSTNDKVAQTFFGKMFKECTESEKDELRMYSGSD